MVSYAENEFVCRRVQMLDYFAERFDPAQCAGTCDNCFSKRCTSCEVKDVSDIGRACAQLVGASRLPVTLAMAVDALKGTETKIVKQKRLHEIGGFGGASGYKKVEIERMVKLMINQVHLACISHPPSHPIALRVVRAHDAADSVLSSLACRDSSPKVS